MSTLKELAAKVRELERVNDERWPGVQGEIVSAELAEAGCALLAAIDELPDDLDLILATHRHIVDQRNRLIDSEDAAETAARELHAALTNAMRGAEHHVDCERYDSLSAECGCWVRNTETALARHAAYGGKKP